jgi:cell surface protein SprA
LGTDFLDNYYEYEIPMKTTAWGSTLDTEIWPEENNIEIVFENLLNLKLARNAQIASGHGLVSYISEF